MDGEEGAFKKGVFMKGRNTRSFRTEMYATNVNGEKKIVGWVDWNVPLNTPETYIAMNAIQMEERLIEHFISFKVEEIKEGETKKNKDFPRQLSFLDGD